MRLRDGEHLVGLLLRADPAVDAVICAPDGATPGVLRAAATLGRTVGTSPGSTPGTPEGRTPGTPEGRTPGTPESSTPGTPEGRTPGTPESSTPGKAAAPARPARPALLVASCVDGAATRSAEPPVTAVDLRPAAYGRACAELLRDILAGRTAPDTVRRHAWALETRKSTAPPA